MDFGFPGSCTLSLFDEPNGSIVAYRVYQLMKDPIDWSVAHQHSDYLDMVKVKYRTFQIEYPNYETIGRLPSKFVEEFGTEMYKYNKLIDRYGNNFEVFAEKRDDDLYFTHVWSQIRHCYHDLLGKGGWISLTYIRPRLFVLVLKDRYYRDLIGKNIYPPFCFNLSRVLFGPDRNPGWTQDVILPYRHDDDKFTYSFIIILSRSDVLNGFLTMDYSNFASKLFAKESTYVKLIDEKGFEWKCTVKFIQDPSDQIRIGGEWGSFLKARMYVEGTHVIFGSHKLGSVCELYVKKRC